MAIFSSAQLKRGGLKKATSPLQNTFSILFLVENGADVLARISLGESVFHTILRSLYDGDNILQNARFLLGFGCDPLEADLPAALPFKSLLNVATFLLHDILPGLISLHLPLTSWCRWGAVQMIRLPIENATNFSTTKDVDSTPYRLAVFLNGRCREGVGTLG